ncbi:serine hydrolase [Ornithinimicrobium ciconiae]|uniref:Serine hydrolase n=1 Tax=Ornithinimicrobium ciconiae TaxID=2594265 RepID=A0A516G6Q2_9MICO|nr:serine hydrolase [Ornithinimicrobium ciconiae]QDO87185.1 serine hydrolase [Ornithinimicrobium ciconiae]
MPVAPAPPVIPDHGPVRWSISLRDTATCEVLHEHDPHQMLTTASVAKVFALVELAARASTGELDLREVVARPPSRRVADSGLWQHLMADRLTLSDIAVLVAATSDNWATNVLIDRLTLEAVQDQARDLAPGGSTLHDYVRNVRTGDHPATLSEGCADDWSRLLSDLAQGRCVDGQTSRQVRDWLALNTDLSMLASAFQLDPLAHTTPDLGLLLWNKTGTDTGVRADVGVVSTGARSFSYACLANWADDGSHEPRRTVQATMRAVGEWALRELRS